MSWLNEPKRIEALQVPRCARTLKLMREPLPLYGAGGFPGNVVATPLVSPVCLLSVVVVFLVLFLCFLSFSLPLFLNKNICMSLHGT